MLQATLQPDLALPVFQFAGPDAGPEVRAMTGDDHDWAHLLAETANRLRLVQVELAEGDADRQRFLDEVVRKALTKIPTDADKKTFLKQLQDRFPTWDSQVKLEPKAERSKTDERELQKPDFLVSRLLELTPGLSDEQKRVLINRLSEAGLTPVGEHGWPAARVAELKKELGIVPGRGLDPDRVLEVAVKLAVMVTHLDRVVTQLWRQIAPQSGVRGFGQMQANLQQHICGDGDVPLTRDLERLKYLIGALLSAMGRIGERFAQTRLRTFAPAEIEDLAKRDPDLGGRLINLETKSWRKYKQLASALEENTFVYEMREEIRKLVEESIKGLA